MLVFLKCNWCAYNRHYVYRYIHIENASIWKYGCVKNGILFCSHWPLTHIKTMRLWVKYSDSGNNSLVMFKKHESMDAEKKSPMGWPNSDVETIQAWAIHNSGCHSIFDYMETLSQDVQMIARVGKVPKVAENCIILYLLKLFTSQGHHHHRRHHHHQIMWVCLKIFGYSMPKFHG